jgi:starch synthase
VGGLVDSIQDGINGLLFKQASSESFHGALVRAFGIFGSKARLNRMRTFAMQRPAGWRDACENYESVYARAVGNA